MDDFDGVFFVEVLHPLGSLAGVGCSFSVKEVDGYDDKALVGVLVCSFLDVVVESPPFVDEDEATDGFLLGEGEIGDVWGAEVIELD